MKKSVIREIFLGTKGNVESMKLPQKNKENLSLVSDSYDKLKKELTPKQLELVDEFIEAYDKSNGDEAELYFTEGFKLGLQIGIETSENN